MAIDQTATINTKINDSDAKNKLAELSAQADKLHDSLMRAFEAHDDKAIKQYNKELSQTNAQIRNIRTSAENINDVMRRLSTAAPKELKQTLRDINKELESGRIQRGSEQWNDYQNKLKKVKSELQGIKDESAQVNKGFSWGKLADGFNRFQTLGASVIASLAGISLTARKCVEDFAKMQEAEAQVLKYTNLTKDEVEAMNEDFKKMDTRTPREQLNSLAGSAGQLGVDGKKNIEDFVLAADKINVALGEDIGADAVKTIGRLVNLFGTDKSMGLSKAMLSTGSAINQLAQSVGSDATYLVDFTSRVAGIAKQSNMSQADIIGFASVLNKSMQEVEVSGTAFNQLVMKMFQNPAKFAKLAGIEEKKFADGLKNNTNKTLVEFMTIMNKKGGLDKLAPFFQQMGLDGARSSQVLSALASKIGDVTNNQKIANDAYRDATSVTNEFNVQNNTVQAGLDKAKKHFKDISIELGSKLEPAMKHIITSASTIIRITLTLINFASKHAATIISVASAITIYTIATNAQIIVDKIKVFWNDKLIASFKKLWATISANPWAAVAVAAGLVVGIIIDLIRNNKALTESERALQNIRSKASSQYAEESSKIQMLNNIVHDNKIKVDERRKALQELQKIIPEYHAEISKEGKLTRDNTKAIHDYLIELNKQYMLQASKDELIDLYKKRRDAVKEYNDAVAKYHMNENKSGNDISYGGLATASPTERKTAYDNAYEEKVLSRHAKLLDIDKAIRDVNKEIESTSNSIAKTNNNPSGNEGGGGGGGSTAPTSSSLKSSDKLNDAIKKRIDALTASYDKEKAIVTSNYAAGKISREEYDAWCKKADDDLLKAKMNVYSKDSKDYNQLLLEKSNREIASNEKEAQESEKLVEENIRIERNALLDSYSQGKIDKKTFDTAISELDREALQKKRDIYVKGTKEYLEYEKQLEEWSYNDRLKKQEQYEDMLKQIKEYGAKKSADEEMDDTLKAWDELHKAGLGSEKEYQEGIIAIKKHYAQLKGENITYGGSGKTSKGMEIYNEAKGEVGDVSNPDKDSIIDTIIGNDIKMHSKITENLKAKEKSGLISHQDYLNAKAQADSEYYGALAAKAQSAYDAISAHVAVYTNYMQASAELEEAKVTKKYDAEIKAAGESTTKGKALEEKKEKEIAKIKSKYNKRATKIQIAQAIVQTAISAMNAYSSAAAIPLIGYIMAPIAAAVATAEGLMQIATIKKQAEAQEAGYYEGGYTASDANNKKEVGVVHANEFVASHQAVANPNILPVLNLIDYAQKNNTVGSLTAGDVSRAIGATPTIAAQQSTAGSSPAVSLDAISETLDKNAKAIERLHNILDNGIESYVTLDGERGLDRKYTHYKKLNDNKSRS